MAKQQKDDLTSTATATPTEPEASTGPDASGAPTAGAEPQAGDPSPKAADPKAAAGKAVRVVCDLPNAGRSINGVFFGTIEIDGEPVRVSERLSPDLAAEFCEIPGYAPWRGDEKALGEAIEAAIEESRRAPVSRGGPSQADLRLAARLEEQQKANLALAEDLRNQRKQNEALIEANRRLREEVETIKTAAGRT